MRHLSLQQINTKSCWEAWSGALYSVYSNHVQVSPMLNLPPIGVIAELLDMHCCALDYDEFINCQDMDIMIYYLQ